MTLDVTGKTLTNHFYQIKKADAFAPAHLKLGILSSLVTGHSNQLINYKTIVSQE